MRHEVLLPVTRTNLRAQINICTAVDLAHKRAGRAVIFDKTGVGFTRDVTAALKACETVEIIDRPPKERLQDTIYRWGATQVGDCSNWIQILSDDDSFQIRAEGHFREDSLCSMYISPIIFLYEHRAVLENDLRFDLSARLPIRAPSTHSQWPGDTAWHGLIRKDVFVEHSKWMATMSVNLGSFSNLIFWSALAFGEIGRLGNFAMIKDCVQPIAQAKKLQSFYDSVGIPDDPPGRLDSLVYWPTVLALLVDQRKTSSSLRLETCISSAGGNLYRIGLGMGLRSGGFRKLREVDVHELRRAVTTASIALTRKSIFRTMLHVQFAVAGSGNTKAYKLRRLNDKYLIPLAMESLREFPEELRPLRERLSASFVKWI